MKLRMSAGLEEREMSTHVKLLRGEKPNGVFKTKEKKDPSPYLVPTPLIGGV